MVLLQISITQIIRSAFEWKQEWREGLLFTRRDTKPALSLTYAAQLYEPKVATSKWEEDLPVTPYAEAGGGRWGTAWP